MTEILNTEMALVAVDTPIDPDFTGGIGDSQGLAVAPLTPRQMAVKRYLHHKGAVICSVIMLIMVLVVVLAPITARYGVNEPDLRCRRLATRTRSCRLAPTPGSAPTTSAATCTAG